MLNIVLVEPEIPYNTGAIGRTCVALGAALHLVGPMGFSIDEKQVRRAGLDYWQHLNYTFYENIVDFTAKHPDIKPFYATTKALNTYAEVSYPAETWIFFGKESAGLPEEMLLPFPERCIRIPMYPQIRSLNLSNSVAIIAYEVARQHGFPSLQATGSLHHLHW